MLTALLAAALASPSLPVPEGTARRQRRRQDAAPDAADLRSQYRVRYEGSAGETPRLEVKVTRKGCRVRSGGLGRTTDRESPAGAAPRGDRAI